MSTLHPRLQGGVHPLIVTVLQAARVVKINATNEFSSLRIETSRDEMRSDGLGKGERVAESLAEERRRRR